MEQNQPLQVFFGSGAPGFAAVSGVLIRGSFFEGSAGLAFSMAAALVVRSLKDMRFILFGFSAGIFRASIWLEFSNAACMHMCIDRPLYYGAVSVKSAAYDLRRPRGRSSGRHTSVR